MPEKAEKHLFLSIQWLGLTLAGMIFGVWSGHKGGNDVNGRAGGKEGKLTCEV